MKAYSLLSGTYAQQNLYTSRGRIHLNMWNSNLNCPAAVSARTCPDKTWKYSPSGSGKLSLPITNSTANLCRTWVNSNSFEMGRFIKYRRIPISFQKLKRSPSWLWRIPHMHIKSTRSRTCMWEVCLPLFVCQTLVVINFYGLVEEFLTLKIRLICAFCSWLRRGWHSGRGGHIWAGRAKVQLGVDAEGGVHHQARDRAIDQPPPYVNPETMIPRWI